MADLYSLLQTGKIEITSKGKQLPIFFTGKTLEEADLVKQIVQLPERSLTFSGTGLQEYAQKPRHLADLIDFLFDIFVKGAGKNPTRIIHVDADPDKIVYESERSAKVVGGLGRFVLNYRDILPKMTLFEKDWHTMISLQFHYWVGPGGYELPQSEEAFEAEIANHAANGFLLGTKKQLKRYKAYANKFPLLRAEINEILAEYLEWKN